MLVLPAVSPNLLFQALLLAEVLRNFLAEGSRNHLGRLFLVLLLAENTFLGKLFLVLLPAGDTFLGKLSLVLLPAEDTLGWTLGSWSGFSSSGRSCLLQARPRSFQAALLLAPLRPALLRRRWRPRLACSAPTPRCLLQSPWAPRRLVALLRASLLLCPASTPPWWRRPCRPAFRSRICPPLATWQALALPASSSALAAGPTAGPVLGTPWRRARRRRRRRSGTPLASRRASPLWPPCLPGSRTLWRASGLAGQSALSFPLSNGP